MESLAGIDIAILRWVHTAWRCGVLDAFFLTITNGRLFIVPLALAWIYLIVRGGPRGRELALTLAVTLLLTDQLSSHLIKPWVDRTRPCFSVPGVTALIHQVRSASFPSSHAANGFGAATVFALRYRRWAGAAFGTAALVGISRVYAGVHYPSDMLAGALLGAGCALLVAWGLGRVFARGRGAAPTPPAAPPDRANLEPLR
jgi:undecaprenyl-diphosphatase